MPYITNYFFVEMLRGIQDALFKHDYDLLLYGVNHPKQIEAYLYRSLRVGHADGILLASLGLPAEYSTAKLRDNFPLILIDRRNEHFDSFSVENVAGARIATEHLLALGHRRIAMITGNADTTPSIERSKGYHAALEAAPQTENAGIFHPEAEYVNDGFSKEAGHEAMMTILNLPPDRKPGAVFVASDIQAIGAIHAMQERGLSCPSDISIVSFDDIELAQYYGLTTMHQPIATMGALATERLFERLDAPGLEPLNKTFTPELIRRHTTALASASGTSTPHTLHHPAIA